ncbi:hypothetical protein [Nonomuraea polychroma]|nr:hypothetical protein [Nonomuraea polychroma]
MSGDGGLGEPIHPAISRVERGRAASRRSIWSLMGSDTERRNFSSSS